MNEYIEAMIATAKAQRGKRYKYGRHGPNRFDCVGLVLFSVRSAGLGKDFFPLFWTVRNMVAWGEKTGTLHVGIDGIARGDIFLWGDAKSLDHRPVKGAGHTGIVLQPPSAKYPFGKAISAYNPRKDIIVHELLPKEGSHLAFYGYLRLNFPAPDPVEPPVDEQPEPPAPDEDAQEVQDDEAVSGDSLLDELKALVSKYDA